jgi:hypothetical protein
MKQSFLDSLKGISIEEAEEIVKNNGYTSEVRLARGVYTLIVAYNDVILYKKDKDSTTVFSADAGDPCQVED